MNTLLRTCFPEETAPHEIGVRLFFLVDRPDCGEANAFSPRFSFTRAVVSELSRQEGVQIVMRLEAGKFFGTTSLSMETSGFRFTEKAYSRDTKLPSHAHELSHFCLVLAGNYSEKIGSRDFERKRTSLVYYPPDCSHSEDHSANGRHFLVEIGDEKFSQLTEYGAKLAEPLFLESRASFRLALKMYKEFTDRDDLSPLALESISVELMIAASRERPDSIEKKPPHWLRQVKEYLNVNYCTAPGLSDLARIADVHPTHLARAFRKFEDCTAGDYIRKLRINKAIGRMLSTRKPLVEIALDTGFADQAHFSRAFKRETGITPSEFRGMFKPV